MLNESLLLISHPIFPSCLSLPMMWRSREHHLPSPQHPWACRVPSAVGGMRVRQEEGMSPSLQVRRARGYCEWVTSEGREAWKLPGKTKQNWPWMPPFFGCLLSLRDCPLLTSPARHTPRTGIFLLPACLGPWLGLGSSCQTVSLIMGATIPAVSRHGQCQPPAPTMPLGRPAPRGQ